MKFRMIVKVKASPIACSLSWSCFRCNDQNQIDEHAQWKYFLNAALYYMLTYSPPNSFLTKISTTPICIKQFFICAIVEQLFFQSSGIQCSGYTTTFTIEGGFLAMSRMGFDAILFLFSYCVNNFWCKNEYFECVEE